MFLASLVLFIHSVRLVRSVCGIFVHSSPVYVCHSCLFVGPNQIRYTHTLRLSSHCVCSSRDLKSQIAALISTRKIILSQLSKFFCIWTLSAERQARICIATKHTNTSKHSLIQTHSHQHTRCL